MEKSIVYVRNHKSIPDAFHRERDLVLNEWPRWSLGVRTANFLFLSGTGGTDHRGVAQFGDDVAAQLTMALRKLVRVIEAGGGGAEDIAKVRVFLNSADGFEEAVVAVGAFFTEASDADPPAVCIVVANTSSPDIHAEIEVWAATGHESVVAPGVHPAIPGSAPWGRYAHAVRVGNLVFTSGVLGCDADGVVTHPTAAAETQIALANLRQVLESAGRSPADLVKLTTWIDSAEDVADVVDAVSKFLAVEFPNGGFPATTTLVAPIPVPGARVQFEAIAASGTRQVFANDDTVAGAIPSSIAVKVALESEEGSYLRRFSWPDYPGGLDLADLRPQAEVIRPLGHLLFVSSLAYGSPGDETMSSAAGQTRRIFEAMRDVVHAAGGAFSDYVQFDIFYRDRTAYSAYNRERIAFLEANVPDKDWFAGSGPSARSIVPGALVEIESIAAIP